MTSYGSQTTMVLQAFFKHIHSQYHYMYSNKGTPMIFLLNVSSQSCGWVFICIFFTFVFPVYFNLLRCITYNFKLIRSTVVLFIDLYLQKN